MTRHVERQLGALPPRREGADTEFVWTDEAKELTARSSLAVEAVRRGHLTGEEALVAVITGKPDTPEYDEKIAERIAMIPFPEPHAARVKVGGAEGHRERERRRYHEDAEYREQRLARSRERRQSPEHKAKERERARRRRAAAKEES
jgi:hypothetical protein